MEERDYWLGFSVFSGIGPHKFKKLLLEFKTAKNAWEASENELRNVLGPKLTEKFVDFKKDFSIGYLKNLRKTMFGLLQVMTLSTRNCFWKFPIRRLFFSGKV